MGKEDVRMAEITDIGSMITQTPGISFGRPRIAGTGVSVHRIATWYKMGYTPEEISHRIGHVTVAQVYAALTYYHANHDQIEAELAEAEAGADRLEAESLASHT